MFLLTQFHEAIVNTWSKYTRHRQVVPNNPPSTVPWLLNLRPIHLRHRSFKTTTFETMITCDHVLLRPVHLRPHSHETFHLRPRSVETTFIWHHIHLRTHSFEITFILRQVKVKRFDLLWTTFLWCTFHLFAKNLKFCKGHLHFNFYKVKSFLSEVIRVGL